MADNVELESASGGAKVATASLSFSGDTANFQIVGGTILSGSEGSWTQTLIIGGAGAVTGGVQRVTLASNDPLVAKTPALGTAAMAASAPVTIASDDTLTVAANAILTTIDADTGAIKTSVELIDDAIYADDADWTDGSSKHMLVGGLYHSSYPAITDGDVGPISITSSGCVKSLLMDGGGNDLEFAKENDNWSAGDHGIILFARDVDSTPDKYRALQVDDEGHLKVNLPDALPAGDNNIGNVDILSVIPGVGATNLGKAEDAAHASGHTGVMSLAVRQDTLSALAGDDGDYSPLSVNAEGSLYVEISESTSLQVYGQDENGTPGGPVLVGGRYDSSPRTITSGKQGAIALTSAGVVMTTLDVCVDGNYLNVNANIAGTDIVGGAGAAAAGVQRVVVATDSPGMAVLGTATYSEASTSGVVVGAVRNDDLAALADTENEIAPLQVDEEGALYITQAKGIQANASGVAASGTTAMVGAIATRKITIHALFLKATSATATNVYVATSTDTDVIGNVGNPMPLAIDADGDNDSGFILPYNPAGWTTTSTVNEALNLVLSAAQDVIWMITYSYVP